MSGQLPKFGSIPTLLAAALPCGWLPTVAGYPHLSQDSEDQWQIGGQRLVLLLEVYMNYLSLRSRSIIYVLWLQVAKFPSQTPSRTTRVGAVLETWLEGGERQGRDGKRAGESG